MWITRYALPLTLAVVALLACLAPRRPEPAREISARALLERIQQTDPDSGRPSFTFSQATSSALARASVPRPEDSADRAQLEATLLAAGFRLQRVGAGEREFFRVEPAGR